MAGIPNVRIWSNADQVAPQPVFDHTLPVEMGHQPATTPAIGRSPISGHSYFLHHAFSPESDSNFTALDNTSPEISLTNIERDGVAEEYRPAATVAGIYTAVAAFMYWTMHSQVGLDGNSCWRSCSQCSIAVWRTPSIWLSSIPGIASNFRTENDSITVAVWRTRWPKSID